MTINRGEIYWARLTSQEEHILGGDHLVVIVQTDEANRISAAPSSPVDSPAN